jgi:thymidylate kinase
MKIAFIGSQGTGKTTLLNDISPYFKDHEIITEVVRKELVKNPSLKINEQSTVETQSLIFKRYLDILINKEDFISDRSLIDVVSYTAWLLNKDANLLYILNMQRKEVEAHIKLYDYLFYFPIEFAITKDGVRSNSESYRFQIDQTMKKMISKYYPTAIGVRGKPEERKKFVLNILGR